MGLLFGLLIGLIILVSLLWICYSTLYWRIEIIRPSFIDWLFERRFVRCFSAREKLDEVRAEFAKSGGDVEKWKAYQNALHEYLLLYCKDEPQSRKVCEICKKREVEIPTIDGKPVEMLGKIMCDYCKRICWRCNKEAASLVCECHMRLCFSCAKIPMRCPRCGSRWLGSLK